MTTQLQIIIGVALAIGIFCAIYSPIVKPTYLALKSWRTKSPATPTAGTPPDASKKSWSLPSWKTALVLFAIVLGVGLSFQYTRDNILDVVRNPATTAPFTGTEISRSVTIRSLEGTDVCDFKPSSRYMFVRATTEYRNNRSEDNNKLFPKRNKRDGEITWSSINGRFSMDGEKLPYKDPKYSFGILADGLPPGRLVTSDSAGCIRVSFNSNLIPYYEVASPFGMAFVFKEN